ncbi:Protein of unknown function [Leuconostoc citreum]|nr:Protein of unknown function [Leuconostoc citreum LBAE C10]CCF25854.1 Protein of unknown function [Leuconostoc citreum LBAE C11]CCF28680.1 Protein of unknown function [Leuconostoc citreum LBAE E16]CDX64427.1 Protein of unknown function [Leuconostoc citreum]CDX66149.1 Protein of unknown function [Leuconostoc citreum]
MVNSAKTNVQIIISIIIIS